MGDQMALPIWTFCQAMGVGQEYPWDSEYPTTVWGHLESRSPYRARSDKDKMSFVVDDEILMPIMNVPYSGTVVDAGEMDTLFGWQLLGIRW